MTLNYLIIGKRIKEARKKKLLSQAQLCEIVGLSDGYVSYIETAVKSVSLDVFVRIANALEVTADELLAENLLTNRQVCLNGEFADLLGDCTAYERRVLIEVARATKQILRENQNLRSSSRKL